MTTLDALGESGILARILPRLEAPGGDGRVELGPGDDCAVIDHGSSRIVLTTDMMVEGPDFRFELSTPAEVGAKAAVQNLADIAAMGARPVSLLVALSAPGGTGIRVLEGIADGLSAMARDSGAIIAGGDLGDSDRLIISIAATGALDAGAAPIARSGAGAGGVLAVSGGALGRSEAGLELLLAHGRARAEEIDAVSVARHVAPRPDLAAGPRAQGIASAMLDVSDGLVRDASRLAEASGVTIELNPDLLAGDLAAVAAAADDLGREPRDLVCFSGEEHEMLAVVPHGVALPAGFRAIGAATPGRKAGIPVTWGGEKLDRLGFDHFG